MADKIRLLLQKLQEGSFWPRFLLALSWLLLGFGYAFFLLLLAVSLLPVIAWWAGLAALFILLLLLPFVLIPSLARYLPQKRYTRHWFKLSLYTVFFGILVHASCRMDSAKDISKLQKECQQKKAEIFQPVNNSQPGR